MSFKKIFVFGILHRIVSTNQLSRWVGKLTHTKLYPPLLRSLIKLYISIFKIDMEEYDFDIKHAKTFSQFFTRKLKEGKREWEEGISSPVDGFMLSFGRIHKGMIFQVKGKNYLESELTGQSPMSKGSFVNLYLSPANYHRVHAPFDMKINKLTHIPGKLLSVSKKNARSIDELYLKNERLILSGESKFGLFHFVFVGATNVGSIRLSFQPEFSTNMKGQSKKEWSIQHNCKKAEELGLFDMGSTIILLIENPAFENCDKNYLENPVRLGMKLA